MSNKAGTLLAELSSSPQHFRISRLPLLCCREREQLLTKCTKPCEASDRGLWSPEEGQILELPDVGAAS